MPYIEQEVRRQIQHGAPPLKAGALNYVITKILIKDGVDRVKIWTEIERYIRTNRRSYQVFNDIIGVLYASVYEFYRRTGEDLEDEMRSLISDFYDSVVADYEDDKLKENGDVYPGK